MRGARVSAPVLAVLAVTVAPPVASGQAAGTVECVIFDAGCQQNARMQGRRVVVTDSAGKPLSEREIAAKIRASMRRPAGAAAANAGTPRAPAAPAPVRDARFVSVAMAQAGYAMPLSWACGLTREGETLCWGARPEIGFDLPTPVLAGLRLKTVTLGADVSPDHGKPFGCGLDLDGSAHCWGFSYAAVLSNVRQSKGASPEEILEPVRNPERPRPIAGGHRFVQLSHSVGTACGLTTAGEVYCWGIGVLPHRLAPEADEPFGILEPIRLTFPGKVTSVVVGGTYIGGLVDGRFHRFFHQGTQVTESDTRFASLVGGTYHVCGLTADGRAYCSGVDDTGQLGRGALCGANRCGRTFGPVAGDLRFRSLSAGPYHSCGLTADGAAYCWGYNEYGQLGTEGGSDRCSVAGSQASDLALRHGSEEMKQQVEALLKPCTARPVAVQGGLRFCEIAVGSMQTCALDLEGRPYCWGLIGSKPDQASSRPVAVGG
jgi:hypothetical protein